MGMKTKWKIKGKTRDNYTNSHTGSGCSHHRTVREHSEMIRI
jgi:hypothetical protein